MPATGPIYARWPPATKGCCAWDCGSRGLSVLLALLAVVPGWWLFTHLKTGFMPEMDEGRVHRSTTSCRRAPRWRETDKVVRPRRRGAAATRPTWPATSAAPAPRTACYATEAFRGDILVSLKPAGQRRPMEAIFDALREEIEDEVPELDVEFVPLIQDQINDLSGVAQPGGSEGLRARRGQASRSWPSRSARSSRRPGRKDVNAHVHLGNPGHRRPPRQRAARPGRASPSMDVENQLNAALYGQVASTRARAGPDHQHPRPLSRRGALRSRAAGASCRSPCAAGLASRPPRHRRRRACCRWGRSPRSRTYAAPTSFGGRTSSR